MLMTAMWIAIGAIGVLIIDAVATLWFIRKARKDQCFAYRICARFANLVNVPVAIVPDDVQIVVPNAFGEHDPEMAEPVEHYTH